MRTDVEGELQLWSALQQTIKYLDKAFDTSIFLLQKLLELQRRIETMEQDRPTQGDRVSDPQIKDRVRDLQVCRRASAN